MRRAVSLRRDLAVGLSVAITLLWLLAISGAALVVRQELDEVFDSALQETAERILPLAVLELNDSDDDGTMRRLARVTEHQEYLTYVVRDSSGRVLIHSHDADLSVFDGPVVEGFHNTRTDRIFSRSAVSGFFVIQMAEPLAHRWSATMGAVVAMGVPIFVLVPVSLAAIFWIVARSLRPVDRLRAEVEARDGANLDPVQVAGLPAEVATIARALNRLLDRLHRTLDAERSFTANSAHELRTPIAAALAQTQRLIAEAPAGGLADRAQQIETQLRRLARLSEKLMQLARAEGGGVLADSATDLAPVLHFVVEDFRRAGQAARLAVTLPQGGAAPLRMDPDAFGILARNLIENALRHGDPAAAVDIVMQADGTFSVANEGAVVPADVLATLVLPFQRGGARGEGAGLGLAIADTIATAAGMRLTLHSPARGRQGGFEAVLHPATDKGDTA